MKKIEEIISSLVTGSMVTFQFKADKQSLPEQRDVWLQESEGRVSILINATGKTRKRIVAVITAGLESEGYAVDAETMSVELIKEESKNAEPTVEKSVDPVRKSRKYSRNSGKPDSI